MKTILVPVNFSTCAIAAAEYAADLARALRTGLDLVHVIQIPLTTSDTMMTQDLYDQMTDAATTSMGELKSALEKRTAGELPIRTHIEAGGVVTQIKALCAELDPRLIVLGETGSTFEKFIAGSPVGGLLQLRYPVLAIPEHMAFRRFSQILLSCDLVDIGNGMPHSIEILKDLRNVFAAKFDILTVETPKVLAAEHEIFEGSDWKMPLQDLYPKLHFVGKADVEEGLNEYLSDHAPDLVVVFPKKHGFFEFHRSRSRKLAKHSRIPILCLPE